MGWVEPLLRWDMSPFMGPAERVSRKHLLPSQSGSLDLKFLVGRVYDKVGPLAPRGAHKLSDKQL